MLISVKISKRDFTSVISLPFIVLLVVSGLINNYNSVLSADDLRAHPSSVVLNALQGHPVKETRTVFISSTPGAVLNWNAAKDVAWLTISLSSGTTDGTLKIGAVTTDMLPGIFHGNVTIDSNESENDPIIIGVTLIINPDVPVSLTTWKDDYSSAMSVSVDDSEAAGFSALQLNGFIGTFAGQGTVPPGFYTTYYNAGMELGCHTVNHPCRAVTDYDLVHTELEPNILGIYTYTPARKEEIISLVWPCGYTNYREQAVACDYYLSARGYNINKLEDATPENFMNLKSFNSHEHRPYPPEDLKTVVDEAVAQKKWFNLVLHHSTNDDGATTYAHSKDIWVTSIGTVIKYILQRDRFILSDYVAATDNVTFKISRLAIPSSPLRNFEEAFNVNDVVTMQIDVDDTRAIEYISVKGIKNPYKTKDIGGNKVLLTNIQLESVTKEIEIKYLNQSALGLTISGVTADDKVYDGTVLAILDTENAALEGVADGDDVVLISGSAAGSFINKNTGNSKTVLTTGFAISGADGGKYTLIAPVLSADITRAELEISGSDAGSKIYDGSTDAAVNSENAVLTGVFGTDDVTLITTDAIGVFSDKNAGISKPVSIYDFSTDGTDADNYTLVQPSVTADIFPAEVSLSGVSANDKIYDRTTEASLDLTDATIEGLVEDDDVTLNGDDASGFFEDENTGTDKEVFTNGFSLEGSDSRNYTLIQPVIYGDITPMSLNITGVTANNKIYNRTATAIINASVATLSGILSGDIVSLVSTGVAGTFADIKAGKGITVAAWGFTLGGIDAQNYYIMQPYVVADIIKADLTITGVLVNNKVYNGSVAATLNTGSASLTGVFGGDVVTLVSAGASGTFADKNAGTSKVVTMTGFSIAGADASNYNLIQPVSNANITRDPVNITGVLANNKNYNASTLATLNKSNAALTALIAGDVVILNSAAASGTFVSKHAGTGKVVTTSGFAITGTDAGNYTLIQPSATADIIKVALTVTGATAGNKVYNGTPQAALNTVSSTLSGVLSGDVVNLISAGASAVFADKKAGNGKPVTTLGFTLGGADAGNYNLVQPTLTADIAKATLTVSGLIANNKIYNGTNTTTLNASGATLIGVIGGDAVTLNSTGASGTFVNKNAGSGKSVSVSGLFPEGTDAGNYVLTDPVLTANILQATLTVTAKNLTKAYRTTLVFTGSDYTVAGLAPGDPFPSVNLSSTGAPATANVGTFAISAGGGSDINYNFIYVNGLLTVRKAPLTARADNKTKIYGSENPGLTISYSGFINNEDLSVIDVLPSISTAAVSTSNAGSYPITLSGGSDNNYELVLVNGNLEIVKADQVITFGIIPDKLRITQESQLTATSSSGLPVTFETSDPFSCSVNGNILKVIREGHLNILARQNGNINWNPAPDVVQTITTLPTFDAISSLFTPNNDGMNDYWYIPDLVDYGKLEVIVYNRFGQSVYQSPAYKNDWDGTWNGYPLPSATYYYIIKSSTKGLIKGVVNIVR